jgi:hypothetical protein
VKLSIASTGIEKVGKTHFACTFPKPLVLQFDPNLATVQSFGVDYIPMGTGEGLKQFVTSVLPAVFNREVGDYETIVLDSFSFLFPLIQAAIPIPVSSRNEEDTFKWYRLVKNTCNNYIRQLCSVTQPFPGDPQRRSYNLVVTCHITENYREEGRGADKRLVLDKWRPRIEGAFKGEFPSFFNTVLVHMVEPRATRKPDGSPGPTAIDYVAYTVPPTLEYSAGDGVGGEGKRFRRLPPKIPSNYKALIDAWGMTERGLPIE